MTMLPDEQTMRPHFPVGPPPTSAPLPQVCGSTASARTAPRVPLRLPSSRSEMMAIRLFVFVFYHFGRPPNHIRNRVGSALRGSRPPGQRTGGGQGGRVQGVIPGRGRRSGAAPNGQLGLNHTATALLPTLLNSTVPWAPGSVVAVAAGEAHTVVLAGAPPPFFVVGFPCCVLPCSAVFCRVLSRRSSAANVQR